ncbi:MAG: class I SAM-dependent methyltransferase [Candidatus Hodarchaeota archaeon]
MKNEIFLILAKIALSLHNLSYRLSTKFAIKAEGGLHPKHRIMNYHKFFLDKVNEGDEVLDIGCGNGALAFDLAQKAKLVVGIDVNKENIQVARSKYGLENIQYTVGDATKDLDDEKFDVIVLSNVLEHLENREGSLDKIKKLSPKTLIRVPMMNRDWITLYKREKGIQSRLGQTHLTELTLESYKKELRKAGFNLERYLVHFREIWAVVK